MGERIHWVDTFAERPFEGNPAAVCVGDRPAGEAWMAALAAELGLSETAFVTPEDGAFRLRWFTPVREVDLCGHATLASAHVLWETGAVPTDAAIEFATRSGRLAAARDGAWIALDFPADPPREAAAPDGMAEALGAAPRWTGRTRQEDWLVELADEAAVCGLEPDLRALARVEARGVIVTARSKADGRDFVSRFFAPRYGVDEDPVTGSAHCALAPFWADRLGRAALVGYQASPRGGIVRVETAGERVILKGRAVTVLTAELEIEEEEHG